MKKIRRDKERGFREYDFRLSQLSQLGNPLGKLNKLTTSVFNSDCCLVIARYEAIQDASSLRGTKQSRVPRHCEVRSNPGCLVIASYLAMTRRHKSSGQCLPNAPCSEGGILPLPSILIPPYSLYMVGEFNHTQCLMLKLSKRSLQRYRSLGAKIEPLVF
ncbi:MAG: hypothetical protein LBS88_12990 [Tannerellaceae bacterium]|nr:hypothetical protein [Tannerellaceae bacterium]